MRLIPFHAGASATARPVLMKSFSSRSISGGSQLVHGLAPIIEKTAHTSTMRRSPVWTFSSSTASRSLSARHLANFGVAQNLDVVLRLDPSREVARHALGEIVAADDQQNLLRAFRQKHRGLPRGVAAARHDHGGVAAQLALHRGGRVINAQALEIFAALPPRCGCIRRRWRSGRTSPAASPGSLRSAIRPDGRPP